MNLLGRSGVRVSALALGAGNFGFGWHGSKTVDVKTASRMLDAALESGLNLIDTANIYGWGASESVLGRILAKRRSKVLLATKVGGCMHPTDPSSGGLSARHIAQSLDASLKRLGTDYVDLYMAHGPDTGTPIEETVAAFGKAVLAGKARVIGCSNFSACQLKTALTLAGTGWPRFEFNQVPYSLVDRAIENQLVAVCLEEQVGILAWSPLARGLLAAPCPPRMDAGITALRKVLDKISRTTGKTVSQTALGWVISKPFITSAIFGASMQTQVRENLRTEVVAARHVAILDRASELCVSRRQTL